VSNKATDATTPWHSDENVEQYDSLFPVLPHYVAHYTIGGQRFPKIGIPDKHSLRHAEELFSVLVADRLQISTTWAKRRYVKKYKEWRWLGLTDRVDRIFLEGRNSFDSYVAFGQSLEKKEHSYQDLSIQFFFRNLGALDAAKRLSELGYLCEAATILRMALEQFAFAGYLWEWPSSREIYRLKRKAALHHLRTVVPASGRLYSLLSKYVHFEYEHHTHFFERSPERVTTIQWGSVLRAYATHLLFLTMACVGRYILALSKIRFGESFSFSNEIERFIKDTHSYSDEVCNLLKLDVVLAELDILLTTIVRS
jgi:hypothetical protein